MDKIFIKGLRVQAYVGIYEWEQSAQQTVLIDVEMSTDTTKAAAADNVEDTINYGTVLERIKTLVANRKFQLVETLAEEIVKMIKKEFVIKKIMVTVGKPFVFPEVDLVGVTIER